MSGRRHGPLGTLRRFFSTPKGILLAVLTLLVVVAARGEGRIVVPGLVGAVAGALAADAAISWVLDDEYRFPSGALLTGMIVGMIISPHAPGYVPPLTAAIAIASRYALRTRWSNVFNPAALGLVASFFLFHSEQSWWGALPDLSPVWVLLLAALGLWVASRINKLPLVLTFLGTSLLVYTVAAFAGAAMTVAEIFRAPDIQMLIFFATFMLTDPPTSPAHPRQQVWFALLVAAASCVAFLDLGALWFLTGGLLVGNAWESARRVLHRRPVPAGRPRAPAWRAEASRPGETMR